MNPVSAESPTTGRMIPIGGQQSTSRGVDPKIVIQTLYQIRPEFK